VIVCCVCVEKEKEDLSSLSELICWWGRSGWDV
jgi:hypothetical protein